MFEKPTLIITHSFPCSPDDYRGRFIAEMLPKEGTVPIVVLAPCGEHDEVEEQGTVTVYRFRWTHGYLAGRKIYNPIDLAVILRYFNVAGADPEGEIGQSFPNATHLVKVAAEAALGKRDTVSIFGTDFPTPDGTGIRDYIHVMDLAYLHLIALNHLFAGGKTDIFNCGYGHGYSVREVLDTMKKVSGVNFPVVEAPRRPGDPAKLIADTTKVRTTWGWQPMYDSLEVICRTALEWERNRRY